MNTNSIFKAIGLNPRTTASSDIGDIYISPSMRDQGILKAYMPRYLYKPPFGYPRPENIPLIKQLAKNPYIFSINKTIRDEVSLADWDIVFKENSEKKEDSSLLELQKSIIKFFNNPNQNKESFMNLRARAVTDILECDSGVWVKVFNRRMEFCQMFARDGGSFLLNPDIYGYMGDRSDYVPPGEFSNQMGQAFSPDLIKRYTLEVAEKAAYFQYGTAVSASIPVPFGRREIVYMMQNPRSDQPYGVSPIAILADIILTLVYGANYNLDFYMNSNMPEGIIQLMGANEGEIKAFRKRIEKTYRIKDEATGFWRRVAYKLPITQYEAKFVPFQLDPKTMQVLEQQEWFYKLALACYGIPPNAMGVEGGSGLRTGDGDNQLKYYLRKSARPIMNLMKYKIDMEIIPEWGEEAFQNLEFKWDNYDIDEEIKKHNLYKQRLDMGLVTPEMVAEEEGINYEEVKKYKEEQSKEAMNLAQAQGTSFNQTINGKPEDKDKKENPKKESLKSITPETPVEKEISKIINDKSKKLIKALDNLKNGY